MLVGRDRELGAIGELLDQARSGSSAVLAIVGEAGIGKSSLLDWTAAQAGGMHVLRARGIESEAPIPFAGLFELLRPALDSLDALPAPQAAALESALALRPAQPHERFAVGAATLSLIAAHAETAPLLVLVDDVHWFDGSSADALRFALRRLVADPIAAIVTQRSEEPSPFSLDGLDVLTLAGLDLGSSSVLLRRAAPETADDAAARLHRKTGGNPLALLELAARGAPETPLDTPVAAPATIEAAYLRRVDGLPDASRHALLVAAASDGGDLAGLARAGVDVADLLPAEEAGLVELAGGRVEFRHPLIRSSVYAGAPPSDRRAAHRSLADTLPDSQADRRAWHLALAAAGPDEPASSALEQAGVRAHERSAYDVASRAYERAALLTVDDARRGALSFAAADSAWLGGDAVRATVLLDDARRHAADDALAIDVEHLHGHIALRRGPLAEGRSIILATAERAAAIAPDAAIVMFAEAGEGAFFAGDAEAMLDCGNRALALLRPETEIRARYFARVAAGMGRVLAGEDDGAALIRQAVDELEGSGELEGDPRLLAWAAVGPLWLREADVGASLVEQAVTSARARSAAGALPHLLAHVGIQEAASNRMVEARATLDEGARLARETGQRTILSAALARLALVEARTGRDELCRAHAGEALELALELGATLFEIWARAALGEADLVRGEVDAAIVRFSELQDVLEQNGIADADLSPAPELVELHLRAGDGERALAVVGPFARAAATKRQPWALARAARCRALLADDDAFAAQFDDALSMHARTPDGFEVARTRLAYGSRLRRSGKRLLAREQLRAAIDAFDEQGAAPWAELARVELAATGETARRRDPSTLDELTPQELKVALLLAGGKTTREAAAALFLSPKTIEYHLRNAYRKLGVRSRDALAEALAVAR